MVEDNQWQTVYKTEKCQESGRVLWRTILISSFDLCLEDLDRPLKFKVLNLNFCASA